MDQPEDVLTRDELAHFLARLAEEIRVGARQTEHVTIAEFVEAAGGWVADMAGYFEGRGESVPATPTSALVASIFAAAIVYE